MCARPALSACSAPRNAPDRGQYRQAAGTVAEGSNRKRRGLAGRAASPTDIRTPVLAVNGLGMLRFTSRTDKMSVDKAQRVQP
jgi:hypothetical protein